MVDRREGWRGRRKRWFGGRDHRRFRRGGLWRLVSFFSESDHGFAPFMADDQALSRAGEGPRLGAPAKGPAGQTGAGFLWKARLWKPGYGMLETAQRARCCGMRLARATPGDEENRLAYGAREPLS